MAKLYTLDNKLILKTSFDEMTIADLTGIVEYDNGARQWCLNGALHNLNGAAYINKHGHKEYWVYGKQITCETDEQFKLYVSLLKLKNLL